MDDLANTGLLVGVDITPPGIELDSCKSVADTTTLSLMFDFDIYDDENEDSNSELHSLPL